jgi:hypothetical protein
MNKHERILDFTAFILLDFEELLCGINYFFEQKQLIKLQHFISCENNDYQDFLKQFIELSEILEENIEIGDHLNLISDVFTSSELCDLTEYLNTNFTYGYPDDYEDGLVTGGNCSLGLTISEMRFYFQNYLNLYSRNSNVFISYYYQLLKHLEYPCLLNFGKAKKKIDNINNTKELLPNNLSADYLKYIQDKYKVKIFKHIDRNNIQFQGFADEKGLFIDINKTLIEYLNHLDTLSKNKIIYSPDVADYKTFISHLTYQYVEFKLFGIKKNRNNYTDLFEEQLFDELEELKKTNSNLITFLFKKGFDESEIDVILNVISDNKFNAINIRGLEISKQVNFFNFCHLFYILDFFVEQKEIDFKKEKSFDIVLNFDPDSTLNYDKNAFSKYYKFLLKLNSTDNPFGRVSYFIDKIEKELKINKDRLKSTVL